MAAPRPELAVSNSFDYLPVRPLPGFNLNPADCSARSHGLASIQSSRVVLVNAAGRTEQNADGGCSEAGRTVLCRTDTGDFADDELRTIVHDCGQLYLDVSGKASINDFQTDVSQLVLAAECRRCPDFAQCCCCYVPAPHSYFLDDERWLATMMASLSGRVLDIGLGNVPYLRFAGDTILEYHGVDPDPDAGANVGDQVRLHSVVIEDFPGFKGYFDHVLSLRSLNHFLDVKAALQVVSRCLRPGGTAVFIESLALPMVRTRSKAAYSHSEARGGFQHLRNWSSVHLVDLVTRHFQTDFVVEHHRPVGPDTCDQWIVTLRRK